MAFSVTKLQPTIASFIEGGFDFPGEPYTDAASATYKIGAALVNSGGDLIQATSPVNGTNKTAGIALQPGSNLATTHNANSIGNAGVQTPILMVPAADGQIFEANIGNAGADYAIVASDLFTSMQLTLDAGTGFWYVDKAASGGVLVIGIKNLQDITLGTTVGARVYFKFLRAATIY